MPYSFRASTVASGKKKATIAVEPIGGDSTFDVATLLQEAMKWDNDNFNSDNTQGVKRALGNDEDELNCPQDLAPNENADTSVATTSSIPKRLRSSKTARKSIRRDLLNDTKFLDFGQQPQANDVARHAATSEVVPVDGIPKMKPSSCGYLGVAPQRGTKSRWTLEKWINEGYTVVKAIPGTTRPIVDPSTKKVFMVLVPPPADPTFADSGQRIFELLSKTGKTAKLSKDQKIHRRGNFPAINVGLTYGQGNKKPTNLLNSDPSAVETLLNNNDVKRFAGYASYAFSMWAPQLYGYYRSQLNSLYKHIPTLRRIFNRSVFPRAAFNCGEQVSTDVHHDLMNCPFGWCSIQAVGRFDHAKGGHIIAQELRLLVEFPPNWLVLMPSATIGHGNIAIQVGETRASFTQYSPGGLFRFVDNGFQTQGELKLSNPKKFQQLMDLKATRWEMGMGMWSTMDEILESGAKVQAQ